MTDFDDQLAADAAAVFVNPSEFAKAVTISLVDGGADLAINAVDQQLVGAPDEKNEANFLFTSADYPNPTEGDVITDADGVLWTVTKVTDRVQMFEVQAFAVVDKN